MLNNGAGSQNDAYPGLGYGQQYAQNMTSTINAQQSGYGASSIHTKRQGAGLHQQPQMQQSLPAARRAGQRAGMPAASFAYTQYPPGRGGQTMQASNTPMMRPSQAAVPSQTTQYQPLPGATRANMPAAATSAANVRGINPAAGHAGLSQVHADGAFPSQGHPMRYGIQQPPAHLQQDHSQRASHGGLTATNRSDLTSGQHGLPNPGASSMFVGSHSQHAQVSEAAFRTRPATSVPTNSQQRRVLPARVEPATEKEGILDSRDFPALGGLQGRGAGQAEAAANGLASLSLRGNVALGKGSGPLDSSDFPALNHQGARMHGSFNPMASGGRLMHGDGAQGAGHDAFGDMSAIRHTPGSVRDDSDSVGLKGLLPHICNDKPSDTYMSLGVDLNAVGLDLSGQEPLYPTLSSPWSAGGRMGEVDIVLPHWFLFEPPKLHQRTMERFSTASVMAIFYIFAGEDHQLVAADELHARKWVYHKTCLLWMRPKKMSKFSHERHGEGEKGEIEYFDTVSWMIKVKEDFFLDPRCIEEPPSQLAVAKTHNSSYVEA
eukprot:jgi/Ulvmu1/4179/UM019_0158.1